ncbi:hypothetical protein R3W88_017924 [Solanum pinnatisectum]|uniref:NAC domain-containing protein n=1 Tax=Solanum pinnatisectum TaxID=50273 RepID=A0AAV9L1X4_9SOLN|nr:hypothetical protein R3W88_017924 [Solanum pinnatisectum]
MALSNYEYDRQWKNILPIGFHFVPTDEELNIYLKLKASNGYILLGIFTDLDIYQYVPHELSAKKKFGNGNKLERNLHSGKGYWKFTQACKDILKNNNTIGTKTPLAYLKSSPNNSKKAKKLLGLYRNEHSSLQQYQPHIDITDIASTSTMQPSFSLLPYGVMDNFDNNYSNGQNHDFHGYDPNICPYLNYDNFTYIGDEKIGDTSNSNTVDSIDQNKLEICVAPFSQDDQRPSTDNQDYDPLQLKMKKIRR